MGAIGGSAGTSLRRAPFAWLIATLAVLVLMLRPVAVLASEPDEASPALAIGAAALIAYSVLVALVVAPRYLYPRADRSRTHEVALLRWAFALAPALIGVGAVAAGAHVWAAVVGFASSAVLLVLAAVAIPRSSTD